MEGKSQIITIFIEKTSQNELFIERRDNIEVFIFFWPEKSRNFGFWGIVLELSQKSIILIFGVQTMI